MKEQMNEKYVITNTCIGKGGFSEVKMGFTLQDNKKVAVKIINLSRVSTRSMYNFGKEIEILTTLTNIPTPIPQIIKFYDVYQVNDSIYLITEFAEGCELFEVCAEYAKKGGIPVTLAKTIFYKLLKAIKRLHDEEICHLDLKLENIMYDKNKRSLKIVDFGFASETSKLNFQTQRVTEVMQTNYCGSIHYSPPEVLKNTPYDGKKADVWSLGVILYSMLFSRFPFDAMSNHREEITSMVVRYNSINYVDFSGVSSTSAVSLIQSLMAYNPLDRITVEEALRHPWFQQNE